MLGSNSVLFASSSPRTERANSITAICIPRQIPRKGIFFSRAYFAARIFPSTPLSPNPPGTRTPSAPCCQRLVRMLTTKNEGVIIRKIQCDQILRYTNLQEIPSSFVSIGILLRRIYMSRSETSQ